MQRQTQEPADKMALPDLVCCERQYSRNRSAVQSNVALDAEGSLAAPIESLIASASNYSNRLNSCGLASVARLVLSDGIDLILQTLLSGSVSRQNAYVLLQKTFCSLGSPLLELCNKLGEEQSAREVLEGFSLAEDLFRGEFDEPLFHRAKLGSQVESSSTQLRLVSTNFGESAV
ncbi:MAG: hypothetical protein AAF550_05895 [Myxococcota bacterium]